MKYLGFEYIQIKYQINQFASNINQIKYQIKYFDVSKMISQTKLLTKFIIITLKWNDWYQNIEFQSSEQAYLKRDCKNSFLAKVLDPNN